MSLPLDLIQALKTSRFCFWSLWVWGGGSGPMERLCLSIWNRARSSNADATDLEDLHHRADPGGKRGGEAGGVDEHADGGGVAGEAGFGADQEVGVAVDDDFVEGVGVKGHGEVELDKFFATDETIGGHAH